MKPVKAPADDALRVAEDAAEGLRAHVLLLHRTTEAAYRAYHFDGGDGQGALVSYYAGLRYQATAERDLKAAEEHLARVRLAPG